MVDSPVSGLTSMSRFVPRMPINAVGVSISNGNTN